MEGNNQVIRMKVVIVGDTACGKTALLTSFTRGVFIAYHIPTVLNNFSVNISAEDQPVELAVFDTAGLPEYDILRPVSYPKADVVILCVEVDSPSSLEEVPTKWVPEFRRHCPRVPFVLVGTKTDLRGRRDINCFTAEEGEAMAERVRAFAYYECSARSGAGVEEVLQNAARVALLHPRRRRRRRRICVLQ